MVAAARGNRDALGLVLNCVTLWNTFYMDAALAQLRAQGYPVRDQDVVGLSPFARKHINVEGHYSFVLPDLPGGRRPLRDPDDTATRTTDPTKAHEQRTQGLSMPVPELALAKIERFCRQRVPPEALHQVRLEVEADRNTITIVERRAPWRPDYGPEWSHFPIARIRYTTKTGLCGNRWRFGGRPANALVSGLARPSLAPRDRVRCTCFLRKASAVSVGGTSVASGTHLSDSPPLASAVEAFLESRDLAPGTAVSTASLSTPWFASLT